MAPIPGIAASTGPQLFGFLLNYMLMGMLAVQVYYYYISFPRDHFRIKVIVYTVSTLQLAQTILMGYSAYRIFGVGYGDLDALDENQVDWFDVCVLGSIIPSCVEAFYAIRLYSFSKSKLASSIISFLAFVQAVCGIVQAVFSKLTAVNSKLTEKPIVVIIWMVSGVLCDILIVVSMTYYLKKRQPPTLTPRMKNAITRILRYTVETGALTATVAIILLVLFLATPGNDYYAVPNRALAALYSNSLLFLLNARVVVVGGRTDISTEDFLNQVKFPTLSFVGPTTKEVLTKVPDTGTRTQEGIDQV